MESTFYATLVMGETSVTLHFVPDTARRTRALGHALGFAVSHLDEDPPAAVREQLGGLARALARLAPDPEEESVALARIAEACGAAIPGARLVLRRRVPLRQRVPRWPLSLRSGLPSIAGDGIWPYDHELIALQLGRRRLVLRETSDASCADADAAWLASHGLAVRRPAPVRDAHGALHRVLAARDESLLDEAIGRHEASCARDAGYADSVRWMGDALGYPPCCVEAFVRGRRRDDVTMAAELLPTLPHPAASPLTLWLDGALALVSHAACSLSCAPTAQLAGASLRELDRRAPGFAARWIGLARRLHVLDADGRCFALDAEGDLARDGAVLVRDAIALSPPDEGTVAGVCAPTPDLRGREVRVERGWLVAPEVPGWCGTLVADHRGALDAL